MIGRVCIGTTVGGCAARAVYCNACNDKHNCLQWGSV